MLLYIAGAIMFALTFILFEKTKKNKKFEALVDYIDTEPSAYDANEFIDKLSIDVDKFKGPSSVGVVAFSTTENKNSPAHEFIAKERSKQHIIPTTHKVGAYCAYTGNTDIVPESLNYFYGPYPIVKVVKVGKRYDRHKYGGYTILFENGTQAYTLHHNLLNIELE